MKKIFLLLGLIVSLSTVAQVKKAAPSNGPFPMKTGNKWVYSVAIKQLGSVADASGQLSDTSFNLEWSMEIIGTFNVGTYKVATLKGFPFEMNGYEPDMEPGEYFLVNQGNKNYYIFNGEDKETVIKTLKSTAPAKLGTRADHILQYPCIIDQEFSRMDESSKRKHFWVWFVEGVNDRSVIAELPESIRSTIKPKQIPVTIAYLTNPDEQRFNFIPGLGIAGYSFSHHGSTNEVMMLLKEVVLK
jgi:hypothetical protein